mgnify:CR=1 FL=1
MNVKYLALFGTLTLAAAGCVGEFQPGTGNGGGDDTQPAGVDAGSDPEPEPEPEDVGTAQALFDANVRPIVGATCDPGGACHSSQDPAFVTASLTESYNTINIHKDRLYTGFNAATSRLLINGTGGGHYGATYSANDIAAIEGWLAQEKLDADAGGGGQTVSALAEWSGCMNLDDWNNENVANLWADKDADNQGDCDACHNLGADGFMASNQSLRVFENITTKPAFMPSYFTVSADGTNVVINRARLEGVGNQLAPHEAHGAFQVDGEAMEALQRFYDLTVSRKLAGQCEPPRF